ncbi:MAG: prolyl oligopeptidase family serine peptidase [Phycisphaerales bacterium]
MHCLADRVSCRLVAFFVLALSAAPCRAQTLEQIMSDPDWLARSPERPYWSDDSARVYYSRKRAGSDLRDLFAVTIATGQTTLLGPADLPSADARFGSYTRDRRVKTFSRAGDLYLKDLDSGRVDQLTRTSDNEYSPRFLTSGSSIAYQRDSRTYIRNLATGLEYQVADVRAEKKPEEPRKSDDYLSVQQEKLFEIVRKNRERREAGREQEKLEREADTARVPRAWYLGDEKEIREQSLSPSAEVMLVRVGKKGRKDGKADSMPSYVTEDGYVSARGVRAKVGTTVRTTDELLLLDLVGRAWKEIEEPKKGEKVENGAIGEKATNDKPGTARAEAETGKSSSEGPAESKERGKDGVYALDLGVLPGIAEDPLRGVREESKKGKEGEAADGAKADEPKTKDEGTKGTKDEKKEEKPTARDVSISSIEWNEEGTRALLRIESHDNKDLWIAVVDAASKTLTPMEHVQDEAWINGAFSRMGWLRDGQTIWFMSEESGYSKVYFRDVVSGARWPLQPAHEGDQPFEVVDVDVNLRGDAMYFVASLPGRPGVREAYRALIGAEQFEQRRVFAAQGSEIGFPVQQLTDFGGHNEFWASPDDRWGLVMHSTTTEPGELYVVPLLTPAAVMKHQATRITQTATAEFRGIEWVKPEVVAVPGRDGRVIWSRVYGGRDQGIEGARDQGGGKPAVVFIHGAGYLQDAHEGWSYYYHEFMYHTLLVRRGYVVIDMDYRASAGYGRDWRTAIYRQMGYPELDDLEDGVAWLVKERGVDPKRVGCYGGSYGGFLTLMAMFTRPGLFACGAALRPVTDWAHYNEGYTSNILNVPSVDPGSYEKSSPIEHAGGLQGRLLICHGMLDDNVLFQDTVRLAQRLIELKKENWEVAMYPVEGHGFREPTSWLDEFRRIDRMFRAVLEAGGDGE